MSSKIAKVTVLIIAVALILVEVAPRWQLRAANDEDLTTTEISVDNGTGDDPDNAPEQEKPAVTPKPAQTAAPAKKESAKPKADDSGKGKAADAGKSQVAKNRKHAAKHKNKKHHPAAPTPVPTYRPIEGNVQMYNDVLDVRKALYDIEIAPAQMYEKLMNSDPYKLSISMVSNVASSLRSRYARAIGTYKTVGTQIREDLDDSILKAVNNSANGIIDKLELENTQENRDVIKLLASNNIDITKESVERARKIYSTLNNLVNNMKPETVVKMIDAGINPMNTDIWTVNDYLSRMNQGATKDNEEKYSRFLYKLEKTSGISETKKKQFIGIYQMMNIFTRDAGVCAGALMKQGKEITMGNLISAYTSRKHSGIDVTIDDTVGFTKEDKDMVSYFESLFAKSQQYITPNTLKESDINTPIEDQHVEHFAENLLDNYDEKLEGA